MKKKGLLFGVLVLEKKKLMMMRKGKKLFMGFERSSFFCAFLRGVVFVKRPLFFVCLLCFCVVTKITFKSPSRLSL